MTNLIAKVAELRELEAKIPSKPWKYDGSHVEMETPPEENKDWRKNRVHGYGYGTQGFVCDLNDGEYHEYMSEEEQTNVGNFIAKNRNAAPELLATLGKIQAGDSEVFDALIDYLESNHGGTEYEEMELSVMRRYADLARLMESSP